MKELSCLSFHEKNGVISVEKVGDGRTIFADLNPFPLIICFNVGAQSGAGTQSGAQPNPMFDPALMQQFLSMGPFGALGGGGAGGGIPGGGIPGFSPPNPTPADTRPPEERFQVQLQVSGPLSMTAFLINLSNYLTWVLPTLLKMSGHCLQRVEM